NADGGIALARLDLRESRPADPGRPGQVVQRQAACLPPLAEVLRNAAAQLCRPDVVAGTGAGPNRLARSHVTFHYSEHAVEKANSAFAGVIPSGADGCPIALRGRRLVLRRRTRPAQGVRGAIRGARATLRPLAVRVGVLARTRAVRAAPSPGA